MLWVVRRRTHQREVFLRMALEEKVKQQAKLLLDARHEINVLYHENRRLRKELERLKGKSDEQQTANA